MKGHDLSQWEMIEKIHWQNLKKHQNLWANFNQTWHKDFVWRGLNFFEKWGTFNAKKGDNGVFFLWINVMDIHIFAQMCLLIGTVFRWGWWTSCFSIISVQLQHFMHAVFLFNRGLTSWRNVTTTSTPLFSQNWKRKCLSYKREYLWIL